MMIADGHVFRGGAEGPEGLPAYGQTEDKLRHARTCAEQGYKIGACLAGLSQTGKGMTAGPVQTEAET